MIVIGVAPGLKSLAYSVLDFSGSKPTAIDQDTLFGPRVGQGLVNLAKKAYAHRLILDVVFERDPPTALAIGPAWNPKEPPEYVDAVGIMLEALAQASRVQVMKLSQLQIDALLVPIAPRESLLRIVNRHLSNPLSVGDRKLSLALGIALTAGLLLKPQVSAG